MSFVPRQTVQTAKASKSENLFTGRSLLRAEEKKKEQEQAKPQASALQKYLAEKYDVGANGDGGEKKKKRKKKTESGAIRIVDQDATGFGPKDVASRSALPKRGLKGSLLGDDEDEDEEQPVIANPEEAAALMKQMEKAQRAEGWAVVDHQDDVGVARGGARSSRQDASPPRRKARHDSPDASPPRRTARRDSPDASPPRRTARRDSPDASPPRRNARRDSPDASPPRRKARHDSPDASPPRRQARHDSPDASPPRRNACRNSPDASPPRRKARHDSPDASPPRRNARHDSPDASPPRRQARHVSPVASPPHKGTGGQDRGSSPSRRRTRHDSPVAEPQRRSDAQRAPAATGVGPPRPPGPPRMSDGTAAGLVKAEQLAAEMRQWKSQAEERRRNADGRGAQTVYRDKATGRVMSAADVTQAQAQAEEDERNKRKKSSIYDEDQTLEWRGGLVQKQQAEERRRAMEEEAAKPFARSDVDTSYDAALKQQVRFGDPFAHLARKKQAQQPGAEALVDRYDADKLQKSGFKVPQEVPPHSWLKRGVAAPANRYNIRPGRHWDGVNRSNGFEGELFKHQNTRAAKELEARMWAQGDM